MKGILLAVALLAALSAPAKAEDLAIPRELAQAIVDYLAKQPYKDVAPLIQAAVGLKPVPAPTSEPKKD